VERTALSALAALLRGLGIRWALMGALAANRYRASPRLTQDVDLLLANVGPGLEALEAAARAAGWNVRRASPEGELLRLRHPELGIADLLIAGTEYQQQAIGRAREEPVGDGESAPVLTAEDVIVHKLIAGRTQDRADIEAILAAGVLLDERYIEHWAAFWEVLDAWRALRG
jgi:hypothetical protein